LAHEPLTPTYSATVPPLFQTDPVLEGRHRRLCRVVAGLDEARLNESVAGKDYPVAVMLHGVAQHLAYHAGQIALLRRLAAGRSSSGPRPKPPS
jgi:hypothetical protein